MATIFIRDLVVEGKHGVNPEEKVTSQPFKITVEIEFDTTKAQVSDNLNDTLDYSKIRKQITTVVQGNSFDLIERLAQAIADDLLADNAIQELTVAIEKPAVYDNAVPGLKITFKR